MRGDLWRTTPAQASVWIDSELSTDPALYNLSRSCILRGPLDVDGLLAAIDVVSRRQAVLRTRLYLERDAVMQAVSHESLAVSTAGSSARSYEELLAHVGALESIPFDLSRGPAARWHVIRTGSDEHVLSFSTHHAVCDGQSVDIVFRDLTAVFGGEELPALAEGAQYSAYARQQQPTHTLQPERPAEPCAKCLDASTLFSQGGPHAEPGSKYLERPLGGDVRAALRKRAASLNATEFIVHLALFASSVARFTGKRHFPIFVPFGGRDEQFTETAGYFIKPLVLEHEAVPNERLETAIARARDLLFEAVERAIGPDPAAADRPAQRFALAVHTEPFDETPPSFRGVRAEMIEPVRTTKFDLMLAIRHARDRTRLFFDYASARVDDTAVVRIADNFIAMLESLL